MEDIFTCINGWIFLWRHRLDYKEIILKICLAIKWEFVSIKVLREFEGRYCLLSKVQKLILKLLEHAMARSSSINQTCVLLYQHIIIY